MKFWFQRSEKEAGAAFIGVEHGDVSGFAEVHVGKRDLLRAAGCAGAAMLMRRLVGKGRGEGRARKDAERSRREAGQRLRGAGKRKRR